MRPVLIISIGIAFTAAASAQDNPMDLLRLAQRNIADSVDRMPRYMCTQTIERSLFEPDSHDSRANHCDEGPLDRPKTHLASTDRLRLDVGMAAAAEMYSWAGESRFDDRDLLDMVHEGAISTGSFAAFLTSIFRTEAATFTYNGDTTRNGRAVSEFGFEVPHEKSNYVFGNGRHRAVTGYDGTFLIDRQTADLVRLVVRTDELPSESQACDAETTLDYNRVRLKGNDFLLPVESLLRIASTDGSEDVNRTVFSGCHEFLGESNITFDPPVQNAGLTEASPGRAPNGLVIPQGLRFRAALARGIDTATAAGGDPIKAVLKTPIRDGRKILVPDGASIAARIVRIRRYYGAAPSVEFDVKLESIEAGGISIPLTADPDTGAGFFEKSASKNIQRRLELGGLRGLEDRSAAFIFRNVPERYLIGSGLESAWVTAHP